MGDLILKAIGHVQKGLSVLKFALPLEGAYVVQEAFDNGYFLISRSDSEYLLAPSMPSS